MKIQEMVGCVQVEEIVGKVIAYFGVIEIQERDLPHAYCRCFLNETFKDNVNNPECIISMVSAEITAKSDQKV